MVTPSSRAVSRLSAALCVAMLLVLPFVLGSHSHPRSAAAQIVHDSCQLCLLATHARVAEVGAHCVLESASAPATPPTQPAPPILPVDRPLASGRAPPVELLLG